MKYYIPLFRIHVLFQVVILFTVLAVAKSLRPYYYIPETYNGKGTDIVGVENHTRPKNGTRKEIGMELYPTGSSLPDCSHACGPCRPCKRVMVSLTCSTESCPVVYRCMCKGKYYHVPSN